MNTDVHTRRFFLSGELVELWENPDFPFCCTHDGIQEYAEDGKWVLLFCALTLGTGRPTRQHGS